jgi:hypothetical protein
MAMAMYKNLQTHDDTEQYANVQKLSVKDQWDIVQSVCDVDNNIVVLPVNDGIRVNVQYVYLHPNIEYTIQSFNTVDFTNIFPYLMNGRDVISSTMQGAISSISNQLQSAVYACFPYFNDYNNGAVAVEWYTNPISFRIIDFTRCEVLNTHPIIISTSQQLNSEDNTGMDYLMVEPKGIEAVIMTLLEANVTM